MNKPREAENERQLRRLREQAAAWYVEQQDRPDERRRAAFLAWLRSSPAHVAEYLAIVQMHGTGDLKAAAAMEGVSIAELVEQAGRESAVVPLRRHNAMFLPASVAARSPRSGARRPVLAWAAACAAALVVACLAGLQGQMSGDGDWRGYVAGTDALRTVQLADGTIVQLDRGSAINVNFDAHRRRIAVIRGNALFDVGKDPARPMLVSVGGHVLQDIGTVFAVKRDTRDDILTVISGRVRVWPESRAWLSRVKTYVTGENLHGDAIADITSGEQIQLSVSGVSSVHAVAITQATAWLPDDIRFQRMTIGEVARRFNAYSSTPLAIEDARIADMRISGIFHAHNPQAFITFLATLPGVTVVRGSDRIRIVARVADDGAQRL